MVVYDTSGGAIAARAWWLLRWLGHRDVALLEGGLDAWQQHELPLATGDEAVSPGNFAARPRNDLVLSTEELVAEPVSIMRSRLVDARDADRFRGDVEPIDAVAGHVPGAVNLPFADCLDDSGRWRQPGELEALLETVLGNDSDAPWAVMCGSGVTACHLAISAQLAGYREPRLYAGSWSEWIRDPSRPVATGPTVIRKIPT